MEGTLYPQTLHIANQGYLTHKQGLKNKTVRLCRGQLSTWAARRTPGAHFHKMEQNHVNLVSSNKPPNKHDIIPRPERLLA